MSIRIELVWKALLELKVWSMGICFQAQVAPEPEESWAPDTPTCNWHERYDEEGNLVWNTVSATFRFPQIIKRQTQRLQWNWQCFYNSVTQEFSYDCPDELITHERRLNQNYYSLASDFEDVNYDHYWMQTLRPSPLSKFNLSLSSPTREKSFAKMKTATSISA